MRELTNLLALCFYGVPTFVISLVAFGLNWIALALLDVASAINQVSNIIYQFARNQKN